MEKSMTRVSLAKALEWPSKKSLASREVNLIDRATPKDFWLHPEDPQPRPREIGLTFDPPNWAPSFVCGGSGAGCPERRIGSLQEQQENQIAHRANASFGKPEAKTSINLRTAGGRPRRVVKTRWTSPFMPRHAGNTRTSFPSSKACRQV